MTTPPHFVLLGFENTITRQWREVFKESHFNCSVTDLIRKADGVSSRLTDI